MTELPENVPDHRYLHPDVPISKNISHSRWLKHLVSLFNKPGYEILEVGSREVTGKSTARAQFDQARYTGFDLYPGDNVDVAGDAHKLSSFFEGKKFDLIYSSAVMEHLAMPWLFPIEVAKLLKIGGHTFHETHFAFSAHERPWHFFHFTDMALRALFNPALGFQCLEAGMSNPVIGRFSNLADQYLRGKALTGLYCHVEYFGKKIKEPENFSWDSADLFEVVGETLYPAPKAT